MQCFWKARIPTKEGMFDFSAMDETANVSKQTVFCELSTQIILRLRTLNNSIYRYVMFDEEYLSCREMFTNWGNSPKVVQKRLRRGSAGSSRAFCGGNRGSKEDAPLATKAFVMLASTFEVVAGVLACINTVLSTHLRNLQNFRSFETAAEKLRFLVPSTLKLLAVMCYLIGQYFLN